MPFASPLLLLAALTRSVDWETDVIVETTAGRNIKLKADLLHRR